MADFEDILLRLTKRLYPKGRAFKMPPAGNDSPPSSGYFELLHRGLIKSENRAILAALSIMDSTLPDNSNFDEDDAANWERALGIYSEVGTTLADRILAIKTKLNYPGTTAARQHYTFIQQVLRDAGFDVYVYENRFLEGSPPEYVTHQPSEILDGEGVRAVCGFCQSGQVQCGQMSTEEITKVVNYIEPEKDEDFQVGANLRSTFFISSVYPVLPSGNLFAEVPAVRESEFRQLILQLKPQQTVGFLFVTFT